MICGMTYYQICWYFLIYSFGGWLVEVIFHAVTLGKVINRGFLNGPVCPVYGFGVLAVFAVVNSIQADGTQMNDLGIFLFGVVLATAVELIAGWLLDQCFHARWWDYSDKPLNFHGYICLEFSLVWGLAILLVVRVFQKYVEGHTTVTEVPGYGWPVLAVLYVIYLADFIVTVAIIQGFNRKLTRLDQVRADMRIVSDKISEHVATRTIETAQIVGEGKVQAALAKAELKDSALEKKEAVLEKKEELAEKRTERREETLEELHERHAALQKEFEELADSITGHSLVGQGHLLKAFPDMKHRKHPEMVELLKKRYEQSI